ncbi:DUF2946 family protein [Roseomonas fluvialis]|uniref:DUF2946 domain-containing protein n=1 Tax=Roseomonas fluvialis TaxID=1750527 RepID=A0ABN6NW50_9PROT|nr:DUF2946 family protein [Roseomonas fluvialis]BDG70664.1 hypothetical protein Rmf_05930 [Roseomonas fluvialis]
MARLSRPFARLIAFLLLLQVVVAPAHCLAMAAAPAGFEAVICAADGTRTVMIGPDGQELPAHDGAAGACVVCHALPQAAMTSAPDVPMPAWLAGAVAFPPATRDSLPPGARAPPYRPTGPPTLS